MTAKIYSISQLEAIFTNSKRKLWRVKDGPSIIATNITEDGSEPDADSEAAWDNFTTQMEAHPHGQYMVSILTKDKAEKNALKHLFMWGESQISGHGRQERQPQTQQPLNTEFVFKLQDKLDSEREKLINTLNTERDKHQREIDSLRDHYRKELSDERSRRERAENQLSTIQMNQTIDERVNAAVSKIRPKTVKPKREDMIMGRVLGIAERGVAIAGHHFGIPMGNSGISGTGDEVEEDEDDNQEDIGVAFLRRLFPTRTTENAIKMLDYLMTTEQGKEFKAMIDMMP